MKPQNRPFIVEVKSSRRLDRDQTKSIWKGVNLSDVTQEIVEELAEKAGSTRENTVKSV